MVREEVYKLQARVDVLEQVRLGWEWVLLVSPVPRAVVPNHGGLGVLWGKGRKDAGFLTVLGSTVWDSLVWGPLRLLYKDSGKSQATDPKTLLVRL